MTNEMYVGVEAEGRLKGVLTLFSQRPCAAATEAARTHGASHVFFGARGHELDEFDYAELNRLRYGSIPETWTITVQVALPLAHKIPAWVFSRCHVLLYAPMQIADLLSKDVEIKLENSQWAAVYTDPQMIDLTYVRDRNLAP